MPGHTVSAGRVMMMLVLRSAAVYISIKLMAELTVQLSINITVQLCWCRFHQGELSNFDFSLKAYYECGFRLGRAFKNIFAVLEGGYHEDIYLCVSNFVNGISMCSS